MEDTLSLEAEALRRRHASTILLVIQDADEYSIDQVKSNLEAKLLSPRGNHEPIAYIIPKWHIQTWIAYLAGENVDEADKESYKNRYGRISELKHAHSFIDRLADFCRENMQLTLPPDSLISACEEFERIRAAL